MPAGNDTSAIRSTPYTVYSGVAAEDIAPDSIILKVICTDLTPGALTGTVSAGITTTNINLKDRDGNSVSSTSTTANHIVATWEGSSNVRYPPMVRKGEPVEAYKISGQDKFYWKTTGRGRPFRTTDRIHMEVGATDPTKPGVDKDDTNTYSAFIDSHNQVAGFKTSKANGEACAFSVQADTKAGTFHISDDSPSPGNRIFLDTGTASGNPTLQMNLSSGATLLFNNKDLIIKVPGKILMSSSERIVMDAPLVYINMNKIGAVIINAANIALNTASDIVLSAGGVFGVNSVASKISGFLAAAAGRFGTMGQGPAGGPYSSVTVSNPLTGSASPASNGADTSPGAIKF